tara:strand:- start:225 stop:344 length:120 start_codon:yes stop_codon:yes gene_type:complete
MSSITFCPTVIVILSTADCKDGDENRLYAEAPTPATAVA